MPLSKSSDECRLDPSRSLFLSVQESNVTKPTRQRACVVESLAAVPARKRVRERRLALACVHHLISRKLA
jgi:hypothetical protein